MLGPGREVADQSAAAGDQVRASEIVFSVHQEKLLLPADVADHVVGFVVAKGAQESHSMACACWGWGVEVNRVIVGLVASSTKSNNGLW